MTIYDFLVECEYNMSFAADAIRICAPGFCEQYDRNENINDYEIPYEICIKYKIIAIVPDMTNKEYIILNIIAE